MSILLPSTGSITKRSKGECRIEVLVGISTSPQVPSTCSGKHNREMSKMDSQIENLSTSTYKFIPVIFFLSQHGIVLYHIV